MTPQEAIKAMLDSGMTQSQIAEQAGITPPYVSQLISGVRAMPSYTVGLELVRLGKLAKRRMNK